MIGVINVGDVVWAKAKGLPWWPARVEKLEKIKGDTAVFTVRRLGADAIHVLTESYVTNYLGNYELNAKTDDQALNAAISIANDIQLGSYNKPKSNATHSATISDLGPRASQEKGKPTDQTQDLTKDKKKNKDEKVRSHTTESKNESKEESKKHAVKPSGKKKVERHTKVARERPTGKRTLHGEEQKDPTGNDPQVLPYAWKLELTAESKQKEANNQEDEYVTIYIPVKIPKSAKICTLFNTISNCLTP